MKDSEDQFEDQWLMDEEAARWLAEVRDSAEPVHRLTARLRKHLTSGQTHRVLELADLRKRARAKFTAADVMFFTRQSFEQATDQWIARYKAHRFAGRDAVADLCCGVGGDLIGLAALGSRTLACDRSSAILEFARRNLRITLGEAADRVEWMTGDVESLDLANFAAWHIDPDRRLQGRRTTQAESHEPSDEVIDRLLTPSPHAAIKLAPACEPPGRWRESGELEWISRGGECRQLVVWQGDLANQAGSRRATVLAIDGLDEPVVVRTIVGDADSPPPYDDRIEQYVYEPDPAVLASGLVGRLAEEQGLWTFASTAGYLTGPRAVDEPACSRFEVLEVMPMKVKRLAEYLRKHRIGHVEIKQRAVNLKPEQLRQDLKLTGDDSATIIVTRAGEKRIVIIAQRSPHPSSATA